MHAGSRKAIVAAFFANLGIAISKFVGFLVTGSAGLLAESVHSLADTGNQALLMLGARRSQREKPESHPFGFARERYFWAFIVALVLFSLGGLFAVYEGVAKLRHPHETENFLVALAILVIAIVLESISLRTAIREASHTKKSDQSWWQYIRQAREPELPVVLLEDIAAELGLIFALIGVSAAHFLEEPKYDALGSIAIGVLLIGVAFILAVEMKSLLIGETATDEEVEVIRSTIALDSRVLRVIYVHTQHLGPNTLLVGVKAEFSHHLPATAISNAIDDLEALVRDSLPTARYIFIEPDISRDVSAN